MKTQSDSPVKIIRIFGGKIRLNQLIFIINFTKYKIKLIQYV